MRIVLSVVATLLATSAVAAVPNSKPQPLPFENTIPAARDIAFPGTIRLKVDATDVTRGIFKVQETIPVAAAGPMTLLFPKWLPGNHSPTGQLEKLVGLVIRAAGKELLWKRDQVDVYAITVDVPGGARALDVQFAFASATNANQGRIVVTTDMMSLQPNSVSLYPAGYFTRNIAIETRVTWPAGWKAAGALRPAATDGDTITYETTDYETLVDSPFIAGRYFQKWDLGHDVTLDVVADAPRFLVASAAQIDSHKRLVDQAVKLFGARHFDHYDFLVSLSETMGGIGLEHHRSSEDGVTTDYFTDWDTRASKGPGRRNLLPHEFTHSWDGKYRRGADLFTADYSVPMRDSLLWVYEGQTQFWGYVLGARSGLATKQETLDSLAAIAASLDNRPARQWRSLDDTTNDPVISRRAPKGWVSYQRSEDYYNEGLLIWMEADAIIRRESKGAKGLDNFAKAFFGVNDGDWGTLTYTFDDVVKTLDSVVPYDWSGFLQKRLTEKSTGAPLNGFTMSGYRLVYTDTPTLAFADGMKAGKVLNLSYSGGLVVGKDAKVEQVAWDSAAFAAGLTVGDQLIAVNELPYSDDFLKAAIIAAKGDKVPIRLAVKTGDRVHGIDMAWYEGLRFPRFEKTGKGDGALDRLLMPQ